MNDSWQEIAGKKAKKASGKCIQNGPHKVIENLYNRDDYRKK